MTTSRQREEHFNRTIGEWLQSLGYNARYETLGLIKDTNEIPDIVVYGQRRAPVIIECKRNAQFANLVVQAQRRIGREIKRDDSLSYYTISEVLAIGIDDNVMDMDQSAFQERLKNDDKMFSIQIVRREASPWPANRLNITPSDLLAFIEYAQTPKYELDMQINEIRERLVGNAARALTAVRYREHCAEATLSEVRQIMGRDDNSDAIRDAVVTWLVAVELQSSGAGRAKGIRSGLEISIDAKMNDYVFLMEMIQSWEALAQVGYGNIVGPAINALRAVLSATNDGLKDVIWDICLLEQELRTIHAGEVVNFTGELWQAIIKNRKEYAAFYTTPPVAEMLATLVANRFDGERFDKFAVLDAACGTGTLLGATSRALHRRGLRNYYPVGLDINGMSIMLTTKRLTDLGLPTNRVARTDHPAGSLALLDPNVSDYQIGFDARRDVAIAIMNPPYLHSTGKKGGMVSATDSVTDARARARAAGWLMSDGTAGQASDFSNLGNMVLQPGGVLALVLPIGASAGTNWSNWRKELEKDYRDIVVISNASAINRDGMSADTKIGELMVVATKKDTRPISWSPTDILCVNLRQVPTGLAEGYAIAQEIASIPVAPGGVGMLECASYGWIHQTKPGVPWGIVGNLNTDLSEVMTHLVQGRAYDPQSFRSNILHVPMETLGDEVKVGPTHHIIGHPKGSDPIGAFELMLLSDMPYIPEQVSLYAAFHETQRSIVITPTHGASLTVRPDVAKRITQRRGIWFVNRMPQWTSESVLLARTPRLTHGGGAWTSLYDVSDGVGECLAVFFNSIFGAILRRGHGQSSQKGRTRTPVKSFPSLSCPLFDLDPDVLDMGKAVFEEISNLELQPFAFCFRDENRHRIDSAAAELMGLDSGNPQIRGMLASWRRIFCYEPQVNGGQKRILDALDEYYK